MAEARLIPRFVKSTRGVAAVEFAIVFPVLAFLFLGSIDAGRGIAIYLKVRSSTYTLDAIANQYTTIQSTDMQQILGATSVILEPYSSSPTTVVISELEVTTAGASAATVRWCAALNGTAPSQGSSVSIPTNLTSGFTCSKSTPCYLLYGQVSYNYTPMFGYFMNSVTLSDSLYVTPRSSACIIYTPVTGTS